MSQVVVDSKQPGTEERLQLKPGWRTTEFWMTIGGAALPYLSDAIPATWKAAIGGVATAIYALARGLAKLGIGRR